MGFGLLPAVLVISVLTIPYITKSTETSLAQVPTGYREGAEALGIPTSWAMRQIVLKSALPGMITGFLVAAAIAIGETAPLIYTADFSDQFPSLAHVTHHGVPYLTYVVYYFSPLNSPGEQRQRAGLRCRADAVRVRARAHPARTDRRRHRAAQRRVRGDGHPARRMGDGRR